MNNWNDEVRHALADLFSAGRLQGKEAVSAETWTRELDMAQERIRKVTSELWDKEND